MEIMPERRARGRKRIVVLIDEDSRTCDRVACRLEADGYHVLTAADLLQGLELVKVRTPDAVVWSHGVTEDNRCALCDFVRAQLPPQTRPILRCSGSSQGRDSQAKAEYLGVALVHKSSDPGQLATVLDELFPRTDG